MSEKDTDQSSDEDTAAFNRNFRNAIIAYAIIEFLAFAFFFYQYFRK